MSDPHFEGMVNVRDIGGVSTIDGGRVRSGVLLRSETPQLMTETDVRRSIEDLGITKVIDLRGERWKGSGPLGDDGRGVSLDFFGMSGGLDESMDSSADGFLSGQLHRAGGVVGRVLQELVDEEGTTLIHCHTGKDRTGFVIAIILAMLGVDDEQIVADYMKSGPVFESMMANLEGVGMGVPPEAPEYASHAPSPDGIRAMLKQLGTEWPSVDDYLTGNGVDADLIKRARARLLGSTGYPSRSRSDGTTP